MNVSLTPELEKLVSAKVRSGRYNSASEVVREALRLLDEHDRARAAQLEEFNRELGRRLASLDRGENATPAEVHAKLRGKSEARRQRRA
jgi:antitoxin ParD1/3/4